MWVLQSELGVPMLGTSVSFESIGRDLVSCWNLFVLSFLSEIDAQVIGFGVDAFGWMGVDSGVQITWHAHVRVCCPQVHILTSFSPACDARFFVGLFVVNAWESPREAIPLRDDWGSNLSCTLSNCMIFNGGEEFAVVLVEPAIT